MKSAVCTKVMLRFLWRRVAADVPLWFYFSFLFCSRGINLVINHVRRLAYMQYKGILVVVKDCRKALKFYNDMFGFELVRDNDGNMELTDGLYLQEVKYWEKFLGKNAVSKSNSTELYFEEPDIEDFIRKLETLYPETEYVNKLMTHSWGQRVVRFYDPDGNLIEVGTPA